MKPTQIRCSEGSVNQVPPWTEIQGDIRLTPFYDAETCLEKVKGYVETLNNGEERGESWPRGRGREFVCSFPSQICLCCQLEVLAVSTLWIFLR